MSFYRPFFAVIAACAIANPVFADNAVTATPAAPSLKQAAPAVPAASVKVNVNQAKNKDLMTLKGMTPPIARSMLAYRKRHGEFKTLDDLAKVRALSKLTPPELKAIQDQLSL